MTSCSDTRVELSAECLRLFFCFQIRVYVHDKQNPEHMAHARTHARARAHAQTHARARARAHAQESFILRYSFQLSCDCCSSLCLAKRCSSCRCCVFHHVHRQADAFLCVNVCQRPSTVGHCLRKNVHAYIFNLAHTNTLMNLAAAFGYAVLFDDLSVRESIYF